MKKLALSEGQHDRFRTTRYERRSVHGPRSTETQRSLRGMSVKNTMEVKMEIPNSRMPPSQYHWLFEGPTRVDGLVLVFVLIWCLTDDLFLAAHAVLCFFFTVVAVAGS